MGCWRKWPDAGLRTKVLVPVLAVMALLLAATMLMVNFHFQRQAEENSRGQLNAARVRFQQNQLQHETYLQRRFESLAREPLYRAAFLLLDAETTRDQLNRMFDDEGLTNEQVAFIYFTPQKENPPLTNPPVVQRLTPAVSASRLVAGCGVAVKGALQGKPQLDTIAVDNQLFNIVAIPVENHGEVIGALAFGEQIKLKAAQEFGDAAGAHGYVAFIADGRVVASTLPEAGVPAADLVETFQKLTRPDGRGPDGLNRQIIRGEHYFCSAGNFPSLAGDATLGYLLFSSYEDQLAALAQTQRLLLFVSLVAIFTGSAVIWFFVRRATAPLRELRANAEAVGRGDFSRRVNSRSRDECGELAAAFNRMTENIRQSQSQLQQTVDSLKTTQAQLVQSEKLSAVGEFVAGVAHELNNPLAAVMGFSELLKDADVDEKHRHHLDLIFKAARRCQKIVQSLLSFARRHQPERKPVSVNGLVEEVLEIVTYQLRTNNVEVVRRFAPNLPFVLADGHQIQQVILNLVNNARQAIEANQAAGRISISTEMKKPFIRISIQDNGPGIPPENLSRIFNPFFTTKEVGKGTGLGLSLCYGLIKEHGGDITVASQPGGGATFTIELPATAGMDAAEDPASANHVPDQSQEGAGKKILLVDDEEMLLEMIRDGLQRHGYDVLTANSGETALRELHAHKIDAICCDIKMPGLNGRQLYDWIRAARPESARRIIFMTGDIINEPLRRFLEQEQLACLNKPFALADLRQAIKKILPETNNR